MTSLGCNSVQIPNVEWCSSIGSYGALCQASLSDDHRQLTLDEWIDWLEADVHINRGPALCVSSSDFTRLKNTIEKLCYRSGRYCTKETKKKIRAFNINMDTLQGDTESINLDLAD